MVGIRGVVLGGDGTLSVAVHAAAAEVHNLKRSTDGPLLQRVQQLLDTLEKSLLVLMQVNTAGL